MDACLNDILAHETGDSQNAESTRKPLRIWMQSSGKCVHCPASSAVAAAAVRRRRPRCPLEIHSRSPDASRIDGQNLDAHADGPYLAWAAVTAAPHLQSISGSSSRVYQAARIQRLPSSNPDPLIIGARCGRLSKRPIASRLIDFQSPQLDPRSTMADMVELPENATNISRDTCKFTVTSTDRPVPHPVGRSPLRPLPPIKAPCEIVVRTAFVPALEWLDLEML